MKHITQKIESLGLLILMIIMFSKANAENGYRTNSSLKLLLPHTGNYTVVFDNARYFDVNNCFRISNLSKGNHRVKIVEMRIRRGRLVQYQVVFNGAIFIPKNAKVWAKVSRSGRLKIDRIIHLNYHKKHRGGREYYDDYYERNDGDEDRYNDDSYNNYRDNEYYDEEWQSFDRSNRNEDLDEDEDNRYSNQNSRDSRKSFDFALNSIKSQSFDSERLKIAKNTVKQQKLTSEQIYEITKLFSFESSRLDFAKYAYDFTVDKQNYNVVQQAFQFSSSVSELQDYISKRG